MFYCLNLLGEHEVTSVTHVAGMTLYVGINPKFEKPDEGTIVVQSDSTPETHRAEGSKQSVLACLRLFVEGDEGNENLYPLALPLQSENPLLRCIP